MEYQIRIISDKNDVIVKGVMGWQPWTSLEKPSEWDINEDYFPQIKCSREKKIVSLYIDQESFSYVASEGEDIHFITHKNQEKKIIRICNKNEYRPVALYSDEDVSISFDPHKGVIFISKEETKMVDVGSSLADKLRRSFEFVSKEKDGTLRFKIGYNKEMQIRGTEIKESEKIEGGPNTDASYCELDDGIIYNNEGVFVKKYI
ncbi:MAG: hypothetical protein LBE57_05050 [Methanosarcinales archaeon]|jgi:hypothetical protein|nr:hypothetical protein [Methanosarcinales archaeon]